MSGIEKVVGGFDARLAVHLLFATEPKRAADGLRKA